MSRAAILSLGNAVVDVLAPVPALPTRGGDVLAEHGRVAPGGSGLTALVAAAAAGARGWFAGPIGSGPFGDLLREALYGAGVVPMLPPVARLDSGCSVVLTEPDGERTFVTVLGAEATIPDLSEVAPPRPGFVHLTGYGLQSPERAAAITGWVRRLPPEIVLLFDPGPLPVDPEALELLLPRVDWWSGNAAEAALAAELTSESRAALAAELTSESRAALAAELTSESRAALTADGADAGRDAAALADQVRVGAVVRDGANGCVLAARGAAPVRVPAPTVVAGSTNGAGDVHVGTFLAALGAGRRPADAALAANEAAARHVVAQS